MRKIFLLSDGKNPHTIKWARSLAQRNFEIFIFSLQDFDFKLYEDLSNIKCFYAFSENKTSLGSFRKIVYLKTLLQLKKEIKKFEPDIVHAHYASSYGLLGALTGFKPLFISVWGTDVFEFPREGILQKLIFKFNLWRATKIFSTSHVMAREVQLYTTKPVSVIPFGVDLRLFHPQPKHLRIFKEDELVIGTIKTLEPKYGIQFLIEAFAKVKPRLRTFNPKLLIVGRGAQEAELRSLADRLGVKDDVHFMGWVSVDKIAAYHNEIDISVFPSICEESFGVAVVEANACSKPVIVTRKGGFPEVVQEGITGLIVPAEDSESLASEIEKLAKSPGLRESLGEAGRERVLAHYDWKANLETMVQEYLEVKPKP